jgi:hypothetical protein
MKRDRWRPLERANYLGYVEPSAAAIEAAMRRLDCSREEVIEAIKREAQDCEYWINDLYQVALRRIPEVPGVRSALVHLNIRRRDGKPIFRDWRHFQRIKNELVGDECEGVEIYPAESRLNDTSNKYHLWVFADPNYRIPFGLLDRDVVDDDGDRKGGYRQRKL